MAKQKSKKKTRKKKTTTPKPKKKTVKKVVKQPVVETEDEDVEMVKCAICHGTGNMYNPSAWQDCPDENECLLCNGAGEVNKQVLENQDQVRCPECEGTGKDYIPFWGDEEDAEDCSKCHGSGSILRVQLDTELKCEKWEERTTRLPTREERGLAEYITTLLPINLDQADTVVRKLVNAVNARNNHDQSWMEYEG